ncbi:MAG: hypothetical protein U0169_03685 [Polyangiaceae bacterium]
MSRRGEAAEKFAERRRREDEAPRLKDLVPDLKACRIEIAERRSNVTSADVNHTRHVVVASASAMLVVPCSDPSCQGWGHDIGPSLLRGYRDRRAEIRGEDACDGYVGGDRCGRVLTFAAFAQYA